MDICMDSIFWRYNAPCVLQRNLTTSGSPTHCNSITRNVGLHTGATDTITWTANRLYQGKFNKFVIDWASILSNNYVIANVFNVSVMFSFPTSVPKQWGRHSKQISGLRQPRGKATTLGLLDGRMASLKEVCSVIWHKVSFGSFAKFCSPGMEFLLRFQTSLWITSYIKR